MIAAALCAQREKRKSLRKSWCCHRLRTLHEWRNCVRNLKSCCHGGGGGDGGGGCNGSVDKQNVEKRGNQDPAAPPQLPAVLTPPQNLAHTKRNTVKKKKNHNTLHRGEGGVVGVAALDQHIKFFEGNYSATAVLLAREPADVRSLRGCRWKRDG